MSLIATCNLQKVPGRTSRQDRITNGQTWKNGRWRHIRHIINFQVRCFKLLWAAWRFLKYKRQQVDVDHSLFGGSKQLSLTLAQGSPVKRIGLTRRELDFAFGFWFFLIPLWNVCFERTKTWRMDAKCNALGFLMEFAPPAVLQRYAPPWDAKRAFDFSFFFQRSLFCVILGKNRAFSTSQDKCSWLTQVAFEESFRSRWRCFQWLWGNAKQPAKMPFGIWCATPHAKKEKNKQTILIKRCQAGCPKVANGHCSECTNPNSCDAYTCEVSSGRVVIRFSGIQRS